MELKEVLSYLGYDPDKFKTADEFKSQFDEEFIRKSAATNDKEFVDKIFGKYVLSAATTAKKAAKDMGIEIDNAELKDKKVDEVFSLVIGKIASAKDAKIKELSEAAGAGANEQVKQWEEKYGKLESKYNDTVRLHKSTVQEFDDFKGNSEKEKKSWIVSNVADKAWSSFKWANTADDLKKEGFKSLFSKNYQILLDEQNAPYIADSTGNRIKSDKKQGEFRSIDEVLELEGVKAGVWAMSDQKPAYKPTSAPAAVQQQQNQLPHRQVHPNAQRAAV